jgi:hypothetical protein
LFIKDGDKVIDLKNIGEFKLKKVDDKTLIYGIDSAGLGYNIVSISNDLVDNSLEYLSMLKESTGMIDKVELEKLLNNTSTEDIKEDAFVAYPMCHNNRKFVVTASANKDNVYYCAVADANDLKEAESLLAYLHSEINEKTASLDKILKKLAFQELYNWITRKSKKNEIRFTNGLVVQFKYKELGIKPTVKKME